MKYTELINKLIDKILYSPERRNFLTTNYSNRDEIKKVLLDKFPEFSTLADKWNELDENALHKIDNEYDIELTYKIDESRATEKILEHCIKENYGFDLFIMAMALLEDVMINGARDMFGHHILTMEYVIKAYVDNFIDGYTEHIQLASDEEDSSLLKFNSIVTILNDSVLYNILASQASNTILISWLSDFNDLVLYHYRNCSLEEIREKTSGMVSYVSAELKVFKITHE